MSQNLLQDILQGFVNEENLYRWLISDVTDNVCLQILKKMFVVITQYLVNHIFLGFVGHIQLYKNGFYILLSEFCEKPNKQVSELNSILHKIFT